MKKVKRELDYTFLCTVAKEIATSTGYELEKKTDESLEEYGEKLLEVIDAMETSLWENLPENVVSWYNSFNVSNNSVENKKNIKVKFIILRVPEGVKVRIKGRPETEEIITSERLCYSINKAANYYTEKWVGTKEEVGNKAISLYNKLRGIVNES